MPPLANGSNELEVVSTYIKDWGQNRNIKLFFPEAPHILEFGNNSGHLNCGIRVLCYQRKEINRTPRDFKGTKT